MFKSTALDAQESKAVTGGKIGPYGECFYYYSPTLDRGWWHRYEKNKDGTYKQCDEK